MGIEPTIPAFEIAKTVHALDHAATVTGRLKTMELQNPKEEFIVISSKPSL
jgi:hypothetical protein